MGRFKRPKIVRGSLKGRIHTINKMPVDINLLRTDKGGDPEKVRQSEIQRCRDPAIVDEVLALDAEWRTARHSLDKKREAKNDISNLIKEKMTASKGKDKCEEEKAESNNLSDQVKQLIEQEAHLKKELDVKVGKIGNIVHHTVKTSTDEEENTIVHTFGEFDEKRVIDGVPGNMHHHQIMKCLDMFEDLRGSKVAGHRGYFLKGVGVLLNQAVINYALNFMTERGFTPLQPPFFMKKELMHQTCELNDFEENLYSMEGGDYYLIATSEQPISALHAGEWLKTADLPIKYCGLSSCFRKEAGAHGKDMWGIFRVHQFEKVEQFVICKDEEESWKMHDEMIASAQEFYTSLGLAHRTVDMVGGELNDAAARKYDLEAWFPGYGEYRELVSCSNCTDFQSRALEVRHGTKKHSEMEGNNYTSMLNATLAATTRTMCCILENYQTADGVRVPEVLQSFLGGRDFLPFEEKHVKAYLEHRDADLAKEAKEKEVADAKAAKSAAKKAAKDKKKQPNKPEADTGNAKPEKPEAN